MGKTQLKYISILQLLEELKFTAPQSKNYIYLKENCWIDNFQQLKDVYENQNKEGLNIFTDEISSQISKVEKRLEKLAKKGIKPQIYLTKAPSIYNYSWEIDNLLTGEVLLYGNPLEPSSRRSQLSKYSIYELKYFLSHCDTDGKNLFPRFVRGFGEVELKRLIKSIKFYDLQIERQALENDYSLDHINLFYMNKDLKKEYLQDQIKEIAEYIIDNAEECIWGVLANNQKKKIVDSILNETNDAKEIKEKFVDIISNYTTVKELESGLVKTKTIDRFIVK